MISSDWNTTLVHARWPLVVAALLLLPWVARADDNHYQNFLVGDRAAGMGGAFTATSDDSSGGYYNPAGLAEAPHSSVSLSAAVYGYANRRYAVKQLSFESDNSSFISYPTTAAWIQRLRRGDEDGSGRVQLAISLLSPQSDAARISTDYETDPQQLGSSRVAQIANVVGIRIMEDETLWVGVSLAWKIFRHMAVGLSVYLTYRTGIYQDHEVALAKLYDMDYLTQTGSYGMALWRDIRLTHLALVGIFGVVVPVTERLRLGASFRSPSVKLYGSADLKYFGTLDHKTGEIAPSSLDIPEAGFVDNQPFKVTVGASYNRHRQWGVALDFSIYGPVGEHEIFDLGAASGALSRLIFGSMRMQKRVVWQLNVGGEYYIAHIVPLRLGFFTNLSSLDPPQDCSAGVCGDHVNIFTDSVDMFGVSGSVGFELYNVALNLGCSYSVGSDTRTIPDDSGGSYEAEFSRSYLLVSIGGAFRF